jgi:DNA polymerase III delta prime subunit
MKYNAAETLWVEKYRPQTISECILKSSTATEFNSILKEGKIPNLLLYGPPGTGKTTTAKALCNELDLDYVVVNASIERGLDVIRDNITSFATTASLSGNGKCFILDEADHLLPATQAALRNASEQFSKNCSFIMTANYPNRIIPALHSRFVGIDFGADKKEMEMMQAKFFMRVLDILANEEVEYEEVALIAVIQKYFPDNRKILGILQQYGRHGKIDAGVLMNLEEVSIDKLMQSIKTKKFKQIVQWAEDNKDNDTSSMYENIYKNLKEWVEPASIPDAILILHDYQKSDAIVPSKELHLAAMCTELMTSVEFR